VCGKEKKEANHHLYLMYLELFLFLST